MTTILHVVTDGLAYGMILFVICVGLSLMMGLVRVVNLAHGAFAMIGGYIASYTAHRLGMGYLASIAIAVVGTILLAAPLERFVYRKIYGEHDPLVHVLLTIGITFIVIGGLNYFFGPTLKTVPLPDWLRGPVDLGFRSMAAHRLFACVVGAIIALALWFLVERTGFGIRLRAVIDHANMAAALGVRTDVLYAAVFALSVSLAAVGGVIGSELLPIEPYYGLKYMVMFLVVVSIAGAGSIPGALIAALLLGVIDTTAKYLMPEFGTFFFYFAVICIVYMLPNGLFGRPA